jgi:polysaccharide pyruvyl transferase WcaK-like protein
LVERVGIGPFKRELSRRAARLLLRQASHVSTRTSKAAKDPILSGVSVSVSRDPAFDYLATRSELDLLTPNEKASVDELLAGTEGKKLVGINLRPIRHEWSVKGATYSEDSQSRLVQSLAVAMEKVSRSTPVAFVFFPMNPIQFGHSDLESAYRLRSALPASVDYRVWEADPDVDGVLYLLRRLNLAVAMRFHACIFALSQGLPVIGVDYYPGQGGKVEQLFHDMNRHADVKVMDRVDAGWLEDRFEALLTDGKPSS